jgi:vanillate O-demethylase ferredoxin subunit
MTLRKYFLAIHRWIGLTAGLVIVLMAITGAGIVFRTRLEPVVDRGLLSVAACRERVPLDTLAEHAAAARPGATLDYIRIVADASDPARTPATMVRFTDQVFVYLNPCTGDVVGQRDRYGGVFGFLEQLHRFRFLSNGSLIIGTCVGAFALALVVLGAYLWWPQTRRGWRRALRFDAGLNGPARRLNRHKTVGIYAGLVVLVSALTGLPQSFDWYRNGIYRLAGSTPPTHPPESVLPATTQRLPMQDIWQRAQALVPDPADALLHFPHKPADAIDIYLIARDAPHPNARSLLALDAYNGAVLKFTPYADSSAGHKLYFWTLSWHTGLVGGWLGQFVLFGGALCIPFLAWTGIGNYLRRKLQRPAARMLELKVVKKTSEAQDICTFELVDPSGRGLPRFAAGAHIDVHIGAGLVRQYSLCNDARETHRYLIGVLRTAQSRGGSGALHDDIGEGDMLRIGTPKNYFPLAANARRSLLIAGGIGVTPILGMAEALSAAGADFTLHYCVRSPQHAAFGERLRRSAFAQRVNFHYSQAAASQRPDFAAMIGPADPSAHLYVCGPAGFMDAVIDTAARLGWPAHNVHREYFAAAVPHPDEDVEFDVKIASSGKIFRIPRDQTVLATLAGYGVDIPRSCEQGVCGTCLTGVLDGVPDHRDKVLSDEERARGDRFTPCCSRARSPLLVLDL